MFTSLTRRTTRRTTTQPAPATTNRTGLAALPPGEREAAARDVVLTQAALVLGMAGLDVADAGRSFRELGFDSLTAVELRNRLNTITGLRLPTTIVFDYPNPGVLANYISQEFVGSQSEETTILQAFSGLEKVESSLVRILEDEAARDQVAVRLKGILAMLTGTDAESESIVDKIQSASDDDVFDFIDNQLGL